MQEKTILQQLLQDRTKIHERSLRLSTYPVSDQQVVVHAVLQDHRYIRVFDAAGTLKDPGVVHHIDVKLLIRADPLTIEEAEADMVEVPMVQCRETLDNISKIKNLEIKSGFSRTVRQLLGGKNGCNHLSQLVVLMGQEAVSGWLTQKRRKKNKLPSSIENFVDKEYILESCRMWNKDGPRYKNLVQRIVAHEEKTER